MNKGITKKQYEILRQALGLDEMDIQYRNWYTTSPTCPDCAVLVSKAMMQKGFKVSAVKISYQVTNFGAEIAKKDWEGEDE